MNPEIQYRVEVTYSREGMMEPVTRLLIAEFLHLENAQKHIKWMEHALVFGTVQTFRIVKSTKTFEYV